MRSPDCGAEHGHDPPVCHRHGPRREGGAELVHEALHVAGADRGDRAVADDRVDVEPELLLDGDLGARPVDLNFAPRFGEGIEGDLAGDRIDVRADQLGVIDLRAKVLLFSRSSGPRMLACQLPDRRTT